LKLFEKVTASGFCQDSFLAAHLHQQNVMCRT